MEKLNICHSMKNIPIPPEKEYIKVLVIKIEHFLRRLRWRIIHILNSSELEDVPRPDMHNKSDLQEESDSEEFQTNFGFKCEYKPRFVPELERFEQDVLNIPKMLEFKKVERSDLQERSTKIHTKPKENQGRCCAC